VLPAVELTKKFMAAYKAAQKKVCKAWNVPEVSLDILLFLANNPEYTTARDIVEVRSIKANLVSQHVDRMVREGYLCRKEVQGDRRKRDLSLTEKAMPIIEAGRRMQTDFFETLFHGISEGEKRAFFETMDIMSRNMDKILKGND
jgi:transcriptional regulator protein, marR family